MGDEVAVAILTIVCGILFAYSIRVTTDWHEAAKKLMRLQFANPYAHLLGRTIEAKVYEGSDWEKMVVIAVSWRGAVCVRPVRDLATKGRWIPKYYAHERVREIQQ